MSCQSDSDDDSSKDIQTKKEHSGSGIADLLASMDMYHFPDPVDAPQFNLESVSGGSLNLAAYRGKVVLLSFWATW